MDRSAHCSHLAVERQEPQTRVPSNPASTEFGDATPTSGHLAVLICTEEAVGMKCYADLEMLSTGPEPRKHSENATIPASIIIN